MSRAAEFVCATNLSCRQAASPAMHNFITSLIQMGSSLQIEHPDAAIDVMSLVDSMSDKTIADAILETSNRRLESAIDMLSRFRFVNLVVDAGTVHHLKTIPCLLANPHKLDSPVLLSLRENTNFTKEQYSELFAELILTVESYNLVVCGIVIDNLPAQSGGLDDLLSRANSPIVHIKCFAHMANLVLANCLSEPPLARVMFLLTEMQSLLRTPEAAAEVGGRCPRFIRTRWFYMVDTLQFICERVDAITGFLATHRSMFRGIPTEFFELYGILLPFACFVRAVEKRSCSLPMIVRLARQLLQALSDISALVRTPTSVAILRDLHIHLLARLSANNLHEAIAAHALSFHGRREIHDREFGYSTRDLTTGIHLPATDEQWNLKCYVKGRGSYDDTMAEICQMLDNTIPITQPEESGPDFFDLEASSGQINEDAMALQSHKTLLAHFASLPDATRYGIDPYMVPYEKAAEWIESFSEKLGFDPETMKARFNDWLFNPPAEVPFLSDSAASLCVDEIWRVAHRYPVWSQFADLALRLVSCSTSESDAERILSLEKNIAALHGTRFSIPGMEARIRCHRIEEPVLHWEDDSDDDSDGND
jgi:hypothetical protein